jgi:hypothetical protein
MAAVFPPDWELKHIGAKIQNGYRTQLSKNPSNCYSSLRLLGVVFMSIFRAGIKQA